jgi:FAD/FMN-containing dehydrogenase
MSTPGLLVNDVHSGLNPTRVAEVIRPATMEALSAAIRETAAAGRSLAVSGGRHAMGGQQFLAGERLLDLRDMNRILAMDHDRGLIRVEAGIEWPELMDGYLRLQREHGSRNEPRWGIAQKQTGADRLTLGGALACNAHGRGLLMKPVVGDVESFELVTPGGDLIGCSREENPDLFRAAIGGYGLLGPIGTVTLRLAPRVKLRRVVRIIDIEDAANAVQRRVDAGFLYGDFQFDVDSRSPEFLTKGVFSCYQPVPADTPMDPEARQLSASDWTRLLQLAHEDKRKAFELYAQHYLATDGQIYLSDVHQFGPYLDGYHAELDRLAASRHSCSEMITELYVPPGRLVDFLKTAARVLSEQQAQVIYGTIRLIQRDDETLLPWARDLFACIIFNLHVEHSPAGIARAGESFRALIDLALERGGSFYLTYGRFASREQINTAYPALASFLDLKRRHDPRTVFSSDWFRWLLSTIES